MPGRSGDIDPQQQMSAEAAIAALAVTSDRIRNMQMFFEDLKGAHSQLLEEAVDPDLNLAYFESVDPNGFPRLQEQRLREQIGQQDISLMASIGYASVLIAGRHKLIERELGAWANSPEAQALVGVEVSILPSKEAADEWTASGEQPYAVGWSSAAPIAGDCKVGGRITEISPDELGTIHFEEGTHAFELLDHPFKSGRVEGIFAHPERFPVIELLAPETETTANPQATPSLPLLRRP